MYVIPPTEVAVSLFYREGPVRTFRSKADALLELGYNWIAHNVGPDFRRFAHVAHYVDMDGELEPVYRVYDYTMREVAGEALTARDFNELKTAYVSKHQRRLFSAWNGEGPVPGTAKSSGRYRHFRRVHTYGERRDAHAFTGEGEAAPRASRNANNIRTNYDDIARGMSRSWKKHRTQQWKESK